MNLRLLYLTLIISLAACSGLERRTDVVPMASAEERQILVMLRMAPPHYRPDASYTGSYASRWGHAALHRTAEELAGEHGLKVVQQWPMPALGVECFVMEVAGRGKPAQLAKQLAHDPRVESAQAMNEFRVLGHNDPLYPLQPSAKFWHLSELHSVTTGRRVLIAEIDTGVETNHPDLTGQIAGAENFVDASPYAAEDHGTAVAGIIVARANNGIGIAGIAPDARLLALRACWQATANDPSARCNSFTLAKALQFAMDRRPDIINLSLGGPRDILLTRLIDAALARGIVVVAAADPRPGSDSFPASHPGVFAVTDEDTAVPSDAIVAPGRDIPTTLTGGRWDFVSGSSYAAAHVAGLIALLRQIRRDAHAEQIRVALAGPRMQASSNHPPMLDACAVIAKAAATCACACTIARQASITLDE